MTSAGFTIVELIVSALIATLLLGAAYQVVVTNQRVAIVQREEVMGHQTVRAGIDLLSQELREVSADGGDLLTIADDEVAFRALRAHGIACTIGSAVSPVLKTATLTRPFVDGESLYVFVDGDLETEDDDQWIETSVQSAVGGQTCGTDNLDAQNLSVTGLTATDWTNLRPGAPVRSWEELTYTTGTYDGDLYLVRVQDGTPARIVGPLADGGLGFEYLDVDGNVTATPTAVRIVRVTIRTASTAERGDGSEIADSLVTNVQLRN